MDPQLPQNNNVMTKQMHIGGKPMAGGMFLKAIVVFIILAVVIVATGVIGFELGKLYQKNESKNLTPSVNDTRLEGDGYIDDNDTDTPAETTETIDADLGLEWVREEYKSDSSADVVWSLEHPTEGWTDVNTAGLQEGSLTAKQTVDGVLYEIEFTFPVAYGSDSSGDLSRPSSLANYYERSGRPTPGPEAIKVDGADVMLASSENGRYASEAFIWKHNGENERLVTVKVSGSENSNEKGDVLLERIVKSLEF